MRLSKGMLAGDTKGIAAVEFAMLLPVFLCLVFGSFELGLNLYLRSVLEGAMTQAGRSSSLELAQAGQTTIDDLVEGKIHQILPGASVSFTRQNYITFSDVGRPEDFDDTNSNSQYDANECFDDENANSSWDADVGKAGLGGANDVVLYTAVVDYQGVLPDMSAFGFPLLRRITSSTTLRNQPFGIQATRTVEHVCP